MVVASLPRVGHNVGVRPNLALLFVSTILPQGVMAEWAVADEVSEPPSAPAGKGQNWGPVDILQTSVSTASRASMSLVTSASYSGQRIGVPVLVARGAKPGRTLCLTAGIHGDELNGVEVVRRSIQRVDVETLGGMIIGLPVVNLHGFRRGERDLPDRRDLNRHFPGHPKGSAASRVAHNVFSFLRTHCDEAIDFHTGSARRTNFPQVRVDVGQPEALELALRLQPPIIIHSEGTRGMLRRALSQVGIPTVTYEAGEAMRFQVDVIDGVVLGVLRTASMMEGKPTLPPAPDVPPEVFLQSHWVRVDRGGILTNRVDLGAVVKKGQVLGVVQNPFSENAFEIIAPHDGRVIGCAQPQLVLPGFAAFHLGYDPREEVPSSETDDPAVEHGAPEDME